MDAGAETTITLRELEPRDKKPATDSPTTFPILLVDDPESLHRRLKSFPDSVRDPGVEVGPIHHQGTILWFELWDLDQNRLQARSHHPPPQPRSNC